MSRRARPFGGQLIHISTETLINWVRALEDGASYRPNRSAYSNHCALVAEIESRAATDIVALIWSQTEGTDHLPSEWTVSA